MRRPPTTPGHEPACPLGALLLFTAIASFGTGLFWHALPFIAEHAHGFGPQRNLLLLTAMGTAYVFGAFNARRITEGLQAARWLPWIRSPRDALMTMVGVQVTGGLVPSVVSSEAGLWISGLCVTVGSASMWPLVESLLVTGRHGPDMRRAISRFNLTWMPSAAAPLLIVGPILKLGSAAGPEALLFTGNTTIAAFGAAMVLALWPARSFPAVPAEHDAATAADAIGPNYRALMQAARTLLPVSYFFMAALAPLLPYRFASIGVTIEWATPATVIWMAARIGVLVVLEATPSWHGRWSPLVLAAGLLALGLAGILLAPNFLLMVVGFVAFGAGLGIIYAAALYYGMAVGHAGVDAGGTHEGLIGVGYAAGPAVALVSGWIGAAFLGDPAATEPDAGPSIESRTAAITVGALWLVAGLATIPAIRAWLGDRARRRRAADAAVTPRRSE